MSFERDTLQKITQARSMFQQAATVDQKAQADQSMTTALRGLFAVAENYPDLKANNNFMQLQTRITDLENQIADRREFYNDSVNTLTPASSSCGHLRRQLHELKPSPLFKGKKPTRPMCRCRLAPQPTKNLDSPCGDGDVCRFCGISLPGRGYPLISPATVVNRPHGKTGRSCRVLHSGFRFGFG